MIFVPRHLPICVAIKDDNAMENIPTYHDVLNAARRIEGIAIRTPLIENPILNSITRARIFLKPENLQLTGSFKFRGAYNAISSLSDAQKRKGVVACSSGNHGQGIAEAARMLGVGATIIMPEDSPKTKLERTRRSGAKIITYGRATEDRDAIAENLCAQSEACFIHPFNNLKIIAGQGTVGLEIAEQLAAIDRNSASGSSLKADRALVCTGGGGLTSGLALALKNHFPDVKIHTVEPAGFDDYRRSLIEGKPVANSSRTGSICDALLTQIPGDIGFGINQSLLAQGLVVSDEEALEAVRFAFNELKLVVEPGGAVALGALLNAGKMWSGETIVCIISGGNIDPYTMADALAGIETVK